MATIDIVPRATWRMPGPLGPAKVKLPCRGLWLHHAAGSFRDDRNLAVHDDVFTDARAVARVGIDRFGRASYSWFTSPASPRGQVLEMQGHHIGAHTAKQNSTSEALVAMGNFQVIEPDDDLLWTIAATSAHGFLAGWWPQPELLGGHRDAPGAATACPGSHLHDAIPDINRLARQLTQEHGMAEGHSPIDREAHSLPEVPEWVITNGAAQEYVDAGGTTIPKSIVWPAHRADIAWFWHRFVRPLENRVTALQKELGTVRSQLDKHRAGHATAGGASDVVPDHVHGSDGTTGGVKR